MWQQFYSCLPFICSRALQKVGSLGSPLFEPVCLANTLSVTFRRALQLQQRKKSWLTSDDCAQSDPKLADCDATPQNQTVSDRHELLRRDEVLGRHEPPAGRRQHRCRWSTTAAVLPRAETCACAAAKLMLCNTPGMRRRL
jgi:hypothetical protein